MFHAMRLAVHTLCVGGALAVLPYLFVPGPWWQRLALGVLAANLTHGILWDRDVPACTRKDSA